MADSSAAGSIDYAPYLVKSTRLSAAHRSMRRADIGKTSRKIFIAGSRLVPKRGASLPITAEQFEDEKARLRAFTLSGIIEVHEHLGDGEYGVVDFDTEKAEPIGLLEDEKVEAEIVEEEPAPEPEEEPEEELGDPEVEAYTREQLEEMTKAQLQELLSEGEGLELTGKEKKAELIDLLLG